MPLSMSKYAKFVIDYCVEVKKGDISLILGPSEAIPLITELYREVLRAGGHPTRPFIDIPGQEYIFYTEAQDHQLEYTDQLDLYALKNIDVLIMILGNMNTRELTNISPEKIQKKRIAFGKVMSVFYQRAATGEVKWTQVPYPTISMAQEAKMSQEEFANLIERTCFLDKPDPIAEWNDIAEKQKKYCDYLSKVDNLRIVSKNTDISMSVKGRTWISSIGKANLPDGEVFTGPIENSVEGIITFSHHAFERSHVMEDVKLEFRKGVVIKATASKGQEILDTILNIPGAKYVGEIAIGTNWAHTTFVGNIQFDEKLGGTVHLAIGNGYPETGSKNESSIHKDLLCDMKEEGKIYADGKLIYEKGKFLI
jgi:aminopeptidase